MFDDLHDEFVFALEGAINSVRYKYGFYLPQGKIEAVAHYDMDDEDCNTFIQRIDIYMNNRYLQGYESTESEDETTYKAFGFLECLLQLMGHEDTSPEGKHVLWKHVHDLPSR